MGPIGRWSSQYRTIFKSDSYSVSFSAQIAKDVSENVHLKVGFEGGKRGYIASKQQVKAIPGMGGGS